MPVGCSSHQAAIIDRDGAVVATADVLLSVEWARVLDDVSEAQVVIQPDGDCCAAMSRVRAWRHKLAIYRDGQACWEGPIVAPEWHADGTVQISAVDILGWMDRRTPHTDMRFVARELAEIAAWLVDDGFAPDDPGHTVEIIAPTRIRGDREYQVDTGQTGDHLRDLASTGIDYTAVGSRILILPEDHCARVGSLTDQDMPDGLVVVEDGLALTTRWVVHGAEGVRGEAGGVHPYYGLLEQVVEETSILDNASAAAAARSKLRASSPAPVFLDSQATTLSPDAAVDVRSLVPGWCVDVTTTATCRTISQSLKIVGVKVTEDDAGERVSVQLTPAGA
ncbi:MULTISPECIES: hypothetical protein [Streptomyces]|uniref:Minor tail protein n=1 Tax=Streptomyces flavovirens TaxID=52258 RepID=A0ABV8NED6_9ACTN|nr:hypothetical protein [Streptomyces sp. MBT51]MBK3592431.1 hypothetical protein [Streptomyces sp. MBT51]